MKIKTCLNKKLGNCKKECARDYEPISQEHPYNNLNCPNYIETTTWIVEVMKKGGENDSLDRKISS